MTCKELVELVTEYLEGTLPVPERVRFEEHLAGCPGCQTYVEQMRLTVRSLGWLTEESVPTEAKEKLLHAFRDRAPTKEVRERKIQLGIGDEYAAPGDHIAYFWETEEDFDRGVGFLEVGLRNHDYCFVFGHEQANERVRESLWKRGFDVTELIEKRRLQVVGGEASGERMLANLGALFQAAVAAGAPVIRLLGNLGWGRPRWPSDDDILAFEAKVTEAAKQFPCVIVCMYDVRSLSGRIILKGGFETHPLTVRGQVLRENPHYVPQEVFLTQLRAATSLHRIQ